MPADVAGARATARDDAPDGPGEVTTASDLAGAREAVEEELRRFLEEGLRTVPPPPAAPIRHAVLAPGKRIRPLLLMGAYEAAGGTHPAIARLSCAVELVHTYSLIHDDLPAMDDALLRRGREALHVRFGVPVAVLAAASLLPLAIRSIVEGGEALGLPDDRTRRLCRILAVAAGAAGMVGGQFRDLRAEGRRIDRAELMRIHAGKTAELMAAAAVMGGLAASAERPFLERLRRFGRDLGLAFQVADDILDRVATSGQMGKERGRDAALGKASAPAVLGLPEARRLVRELVGRARREVEGRPRTGSLLRIAELVAARGAGP